MSQQYDTRLGPYPATTWFKERFRAVMEDRGVASEAELIRGLVEGWVGEDRAEIGEMSRKFGRDLDGV